MVFSILSVAGNAQGMLPSRLRVDLEGVVPLETEQPLADSVLMPTQSKWYGRMKGGSSS
jgi:hypothetical protein